MWCTQFLIIRLLESKMAAKLICFNANSQILWRHFIVRAVWGTFVLSVLFIKREQMYECERSCLQSWRASGWRPNNNLPSWKSNYRRDRRITSFPPKYSSKDLQRRDRPITLLNVHTSCFALSLMYRTTL